jgi:L-asparaginase
MMNLYKTVSINTVAPKQAQTSVLMIYTGGTLGMAYDKLHQLVPFDFEQILEKVPELHQFDCKITVIAFEHPLDSANVNPVHWLELAAIIEENYDEYDGFVILHGTDTMAFSASALSFLLENLSKPVVFTGAQLPVGAIRTDARVNLITALEIASATAINGKCIVPEVSIFFNDELLRGNRSKKVETARFDAFQSDNYPYLAKVGVNLDFNTRFFLPLKPEKKLSVQKNLCKDVAILKLFPGISDSLIKNIIDTPNLKGLVIETFGSGNAPTNKWFTDLLRYAIEKDITILNISQCSGGKVVLGKYATSRHMLELGILSGADMTSEAAITKMMYVLGKNLSKSETADLLTISLRGEMM